MPEVYYTQAKNENEVENVESILRDYLGITEVKVQALIGKEDYE